MFVKARKPRVAAYEPFESLAEDTHIIDYLRLPTMSLAQQRPN